jgi:hypothetical protein
MFMLFLSTLPGTIGNHRFKLTTYGTTAMFIASKSSPNIKNLFVDFVANKGKVKGMNLDVRSVV